MSTEISTPEITSGVAMRTFSWSRLFWQCLVAVFLFGAANIYTYETSGFFQRERDYTDAVSSLATRSNVHILFVGDSHFGVPLNDYLNLRADAPAYSIAYGGDSPRECYAKLRRALDLAPHVDTVIVEADPHMFGRARLESSNRSFADRYFLMYGDASGLPAGLWSALLQQVPLFSDDFLQYFRKSLGALLGGTAVRARAEGDPLDWSRLTEAERMKEAVETGREDHDGISTDPRPFIWYKRMLDLARERHIRVIGMRFPVHVGYSSAAPADQVAALDRFLLSNGMALIIDLRGSLTDPRDFEDPDHVNEIGVVALTPIVEQALHRSLLKRSP